MSFATEPIASSKTSAASTLLLSLPVYVLSLVALVGLIVLTALNDVPSDTSIPLIAVIAGVHTGAAANASGNNTST